MKNAIYKKHFASLPEKNFYLFYKEGVKKYETKLQEAINNVIDVDIPADENIEFVSRHKLKKLLAVPSIWDAYPDLQHSLEDLSFEKRRAFTLCKKMNLANTWQNLPESNLLSWKFYISLQKKQDEESISVR